MGIDEKYKKEDLERLIFIENKSYREIGRIYSVSDTYIKKIANKLGISLRKRKEQPEGFKPHNTGKAKKINCQQCEKELTPYSKHQKFCSMECGVNYKVFKKYESYLENQKDYCHNNDMRFVKKHILNDQNNKCLICDIDNKWNGKSLIFILDHIDGNASNNFRINLRLICHNCDSQLETYKSKNKNSARKERYLKNYKNYG
jgi:hypothetical protein